MVNTLFLEDGDLLENVMISNQIHESEFEEFDRLLSEQEMMISIYENQQFLIEQDTQIFMRLRYDVVNEGVLENIGKAIMTILNKIRELISKFIGFITGRRKSEKSNEKTIKEVEKHEEEIHDNIKEIEKAIEVGTKNLESSIKNARDAGVDEDRILKTKEDIDEYFTAVQSAENYQIIDINPDTMRKLNITKEWTELEEIVDIIEATVEALNKKDSNKLPKNIKDKYEKYKESLAIQKEDQDSNFVIPNNKCDMNTYYQKYYKNAKAFFRNYTDDSAKNINSLGKIRAKLDKLSVRIHYILRDTDYSNTHYVSVARKINSMISSISSDCSNRIKTLVDVEKAYQAYKNNMKITMQHYNQSIKTAKKVSETADLYNDVLNAALSGDFNKVFDIQYDTYKRLANIINKL